MSQLPTYGQNIIDFIGGAGATSAADAWAKSRERYKSQKDDFKPASMVDIIYGAVERAKADTKAVVLQTQVAKEVVKEADEQSRVTFWKMPIIWALVAVAAIIFIRR